MRTIIKITKQEAINAWKKENKHIAVGDDTTVEIEEPQIGVSGGASIKHQDYLKGVVQC